MLKSESGVDVVNRTSTRRGPAVDAAGSFELHDEPERIRNAATRLRVRYGDWVGTRDLQEPGGDHGS